MNLSQLPHLARCRPPSMQPRRAGLIGAFLFAATLASAAPFFFEFGPANSALWTGSTPVTPASVYGPASGFGWSSAAGLSASTHAYRTVVENKSRGTSEPPPMWTSPITEDAIFGASPSTFLFSAPAGDYEIALICGTSDPARRSQYFEFTVEAGKTRRLVQIEGCHRFQTVRLRAQVGNDPLAITFTPRSKWVVNALVAWTAAEAENVQREILTPIMDWTYRMPPAEWAKWKQEPEPAAAPLPPISAGDQERGFLVYSRPTLECVFPQTRPQAPDLNPELRVFSPPGEAIATNFVVLPLRDLSDARVACSDLGSIPSANVEIRAVRYLRARPNYTVQYRYRIVPDVLERFDSLDLAAGQNARFWLTLRVPDGTPAGTYRGQVTFSCAGATAAIPLQLRVLPIQLRENPEKLFGLYYRHPYDLAASAPDAVSRDYFRRKAELEHRDMAAHGTRNVVLSSGGRAADASGDFRFNWELLADKIELGRKYGFVGPIVMGIPTESVYEKYMHGRPGSHLSGVKDPPEAFAREITALVQAVEAERRRRGWPEFLYYPVDEPSTAPTAVSFMVKVLRACKAAGVRTYVTADPTHEQFAPLRPWVDVWCTQPFAPDRKTVLADTRARGVEYWCYPNHVNGENDHTPVAGARMTYGFGFWRSGFRALIPWIYQYNVGDPFNYLDGATSDFFNRSEPDGTPIPVAMWEAYREGYTDYRYVHTLEQLITEAKQRGEPGALAAAAKAEAELTFVHDAIRVQPKYKHDDLWHPADFDVYRWIVAQEILQLQTFLSSPSSSPSR